MKLHTLFKNHKVIPAISMGLLLSLCGCSKGGGKVDAQAAGKINARLDVIRQAGQPVTLAELNAWYPDPPAAANAAPLYAEAFAALASENAKSKSFRAQNQRALALLHQAAAKSQCRYPLDLGQGPNVLLPHLGKIKTCAQLLSQEAVADAANGRLEQAAQCLFDGLHLARSLEQEPLLLSQLTRITSDSILQSGLRCALSLKPFPEEQLAALQMALDKQARAMEESLPRPMIAERCTVVWMFQMPAQEYEKLSSSMGTNCPLGAPAEFERYRKGAEFNEDFSLCLDYFSNWIAIASAPFPSCLEQAGQWAPEASAQISRARANGCRIAGMALPEYDRLLERTADCVGELRAAQAALAVERYRLAGGHTLPDSLNPLVPQYLTAVPNDPYDGKPLRYRKLSPKGYVVYSIGRDRHDDGGAPKPEGGKVDGPFDVTFSMHR